jgi:hypothetical protein
MRSIRIFLALMFSATICASVYAEGSSGPDLSGCHAKVAKASSQSATARTAADKFAVDSTNTPSRACFESLADSALLAMKTRAEALKVGGVAVVAYFDGDKVESWSSRMVVVGRLKDEPSGTQKGSNLLGIAYAKAAEMADTLKNSGSQVRPPMTGEFGWEGGVIARAKDGYLIAAFSGGQSSDDVDISHVGVAQILDQLKTAH